MLSLFKGKPPSAATTDQAAPARLRAVHWLLIVSIVLLLAVTAFAFWTGESGLLEQILTLVSTVVIAILGWAIGRHSSPHP